MNLYNKPNWSNTIAEFNNDDSVITKSDEKWYITNIREVNNPKIVIIGSRRLLVTNKSIVSRDNPVIITIISGNNINRSFKDIFLLLMN